MDTCPADKPLQALRPRPTRLATIALVAAATLSFSAPATAQDSSYACLGQLMLFGGNFCPRGYAEANGDMVSIASNTALFAIYGTMYGGNGTTNFALPDLRGRAPLGQGNGPNLPPAVQGSLVGAPTVSLTEDQLAPHSHSLGGNFGTPNSSQPEGKNLAGANIYNSNPPPSALSAQSIGKTGKGAPIPIQSPAQVIRWCVATQGIFCSRP